MKFLFYLLSIVVVLNAKSIDLSNQEYTLNDKAFIIYDTQKILNIDNIRNSSLWKPLEKKTRGGFKKQTIWLKLQVSNKKQDNKYYISYNFPIIKNFEVFQYIDSTLLNHSIFDTNSKKNRWLNTLQSSHFIVPIQFRQGIPTDIYIKLEHWGSIPLNIKILNNDELINNENLKSFLNGIFLGILFIIVAYHLVIYFITRYLYYFSYSTLVLMLFLFNLFYSGYAERYLFSFNNSLSMYVYQSVLFFMFTMLVVFSNHLLEFSNKLPKVWKFLKSLLACYFIILIAFFISNPLSLKNELSYMLIKTYHPLLVMILLTIIGSAIYLAIKEKNRVNTLFVVAWTPIFIAGFIFILEIAGISKQISFLSYGIWSSNVIEAILFSQILAFKIRYDKQENIELSINNEALENIVHKRTKELKEQLYIDDLTHLKNRRSLYEISSNQNKAVIILIDIYDFKSINDFYGVEICNNLLKNFSSWLKDYADKNNYEIFRLSGDVFAFYKLQNDDSDFSEIATKILNSVYFYRFKDNAIDEELEINVNIGITLSNSNLLEKAEIALETAKKSDESFCIYKDTMDRSMQISNNIKKRKEIKEVFDKNYFVPFFQPISDRNGNIIKHEVLMRMIKIEDNGDTTYLTPIAFFEYILKAKLYKKISINVIEQSFIVMKKFNKMFSINVNYQEINSKEFRENFKNLLEKYAIGNYLIVEITETEHIENYALLQNFLQSIKKYGVKIAIDDFGSGFSNFEQIIKTSPEYIKIDGSIISNIINDQKSLQLVKSIVSFANAMGISTIAEFVSDEAIFKITKELNIDEFQGYYIGKPSQNIL